MKSIDHTRTHIDFFINAGINRFHIGVIPNDGDTKLKPRIHRDLSSAKILDPKFHSYLTARNHAGYNIYIRPSDEITDHNVIFLDDLLDDEAVSVLSDDYLSMPVRTSAAGGHQLWLVADQSMNPSWRHRVQTLLAKEFDADPNSTSGKKFGRLCGFRNMKPGRNKCWINASTASGQMLFGVTDYLKMDTSEATESTLSGLNRDAAGYDEARLITALEAIDPSDYEIWLRVGMALHSIGRRDLWDAWSSGSDKFDAAEQEKTWQSFTAGGVGVGTIFWLAEGAA